jgi:transposase-like protein
MDGVSGLEEGARAIFPEVIVQRCIVHLIRNSVKYVPSKDYKAFTKALKKVYGAPSLQACLSAFESFKQQWAAYPGAVDVWTRNFSHIEGIPYSQIPLQPDIHIPNQKPIIFIKY